MYTENNEIDQDRVRDTIEHFEKFGYVMFPQNKKTYEWINKKKKSGLVFEAGCGMGLGSYIVNATLATDKLEKNIKFAQELYPRLNFKTWDISIPRSDKFDVVVCVEAIEHIKNYRQGIKNLITIATKEVWISTPNRKASNENQPTNPYHVKEFTPEEILEMIGDYKVKILDWDTFKEVGTDTKISPLVYHITL